jgi:ketosteroid isomerase-like protein
MASREREIREAEARLRAAMLANDTAALATLLHDELSFAGPDGTSVGKADDLAAHAARRLRLTRLDVEDLQLEVDGVDVVVSVRAGLAGTFDGSPCDGTYRYLRRWTMADGRWQIIAGSVSLEGAAPRNTLTRR